MFEDVKLINDKLTKINKSWCETIHPDKRSSECISNIIKGKDEGYSYSGWKNGAVQTKENYII